MVAVLAAAASAAAARAAGDRFYGRADGTAGGLMAVKPAERAQREQRLQ
jgi:hypothetical protein